VAGGVGSAREEAARALATVRARRAEAEAGADRWDRWQADQRVARDFPRQTEADRVAREALDRARTVARMGAALGQWRSATDALTASTAAESGLRAVLAEAWVEGYDPVEAAGPDGTTALAARLTADAASLEEADQALAGLLRRATDLDRGDASLTERQGSADAAVEAAGAADARMATLRPGRRPGPGPRARRVGAGRGTP
jgi:predicted nucleic acid-binding protein